MTEKELHKLRRQDLLQMLLAKSKDAAQLQDRITTLEGENAELSDTVERLKTRLDAKDAQIEHLKHRLDNKDARIAELREAGRIKADTQVSLDVEELFDVGRRAAEAFLKEKLGEQGLVEPFEEEDEQPEEAAAEEPDAEASAEQPEEPPAEERKKTGGGAAAFGKMIRNYLLLTV